MSEPAIEVKDPSRIRCLIMPSPRSTPSSQARQVGVPLELSTRSIQFPSLSSSGKPQPACPSVALSVAPAALAGDALKPPESQVIPGWAGQSVYVVCGLLMGLCNLIAPDYIQSCAHFLCPAWSAALLLHVVACSSRGEVWVWAGLMTWLLLPFVILVASPLFVGFYLFVFAAFSSGAFWRRLQGVQFILAWFCWAGFFLACGLGMGSVPVHMHLSVAAFFSISLGVLTSGCPCFVIRVGYPQ
jgi:hypothetical protein